LPNSAPVGIRSRDEVKRYWRCIEWDPGSFLTLHDGRRSRIFHQRLTTSWPSSIANALTQFGRVVFRATRLFVRAAIRRRQLAPPPQLPFAVVACVGTEKYRYGEEALADAIARHGLVPLLLTPQEGKARDAGHYAVVPEENLECVDIAGASIDFGREILSAAPTWLAASDPLQRALAIDVITSIFGYFVYRRFFDRLTRDFGLPQFVISVMPTGLMSRCLASSMKDHGVPTAGIRTQTTSQSLEHLAINSEILFCKSRFEELGYSGLFSYFHWGGPSLERGCVMSLPIPSTDVEIKRPTLARDLPEEYVLVFGTAPSCKPDGKNDLEVHHRKLLRIAKQLSMSVVYKLHPLDQGNDVAEFAREEGLDDLTLWSPHMGSNHRLIMKASLVISDVTTLLYGCIGARKPVVIVESITTAQGDDEFRNSPIPRIRWREDVADVTLSIAVAYRGRDDVIQWFDEEYYVSDDADAVASKLMRIATSRRAAREAEAKLECAVASGRPDGARVSQ
jgi:hypothetical protein